ncbi:MAG: type II toxin-antitoxin system HicA family toxin [Thermodesulfobacteriota bacterium]
MNNRHRKTLEAIFAKPVRGDVRWAEIEALMRALGAEVEEGAGSRVRFAKDGRMAVFHRPHPQPETDKGALRRVRLFLLELGVRP